MGQRDAASAELDVLEKLNPPAEAAQRIAALNKELDRQQRSAQQSPVGGYVGLELGFDDNVGTWPEGLELFPGATLEAIDSGYGSVRAGGWYRMQPAADQKVTLSLNGQMRANQEDDAELGQLGHALRFVEGDVGQPREGVDPQRQAIGPQQHANGQKADDLVDAEALQQRDQDPGQGQENRRFYPDHLETVWQ